MGQKDKAETVTIPESWKNVADVNPVFCYAEDIILYLTILPILLAITKLMKGPVPTWVAVALLPAFFAVLTAIRLRTRRIITFSLSLIGIMTAAVIAFIWLGSWPAVITAVIAAGVCIYKVRNTIALQEAKQTHSFSDQKQTHLGHGPVIASFILCFIVYLGSYRYRSKAFMTISVCCFVAVCAFWIIYTHSYGRSCFSRWEKQNGAAEAKPQKFGNGFFAFLSILCCSAATAIAIFTSSIFNTSWINDWLLNLFDSANTSHLSKTKLQPSKTPSSDLSQIIKNLSEAAAHDSKPSLFSNFLSVFFKIFIYAIIIIAILVVVSSLARAVSAMLKHLNNNIYEERHSVLFNKKPSKETRKKFHQTAKSITFSVRGSNRLKIRRIFLGFVRKHQSSSTIFSSDTPMEIARKTGSSAANPEAAASLYELARYSNMECSARDVAMMRENLRRKTSQQTGSNGNHPH